MVSIEMTLSPKPGRSVWAPYPSSGEPLLKAMARAVLIVHNRQWNGSCAGCFSPSGDITPVRVRYLCYGARLAEQILAG